jgi:[ribosomal protein S5]-alanine N-acetyltransferase
MKDTLETPRLVLRPFRDTDLSQVLRYRTDERVWRYIGGQPETEAEVRGFLQRVHDYSERAPQVQYRLAVVLRDGDEVIGGCGLDISNADLKEAEVGYHLRPDHWGKGIGTEVTKALLGFGFRDLGMHRIFADCSAENPASARVMEKAGMRREAHFRKNARIGDRWHDTLVYAALADEWGAV